MQFAITTANGREEIDIRPMDAFAAMQSKKLPTLGHLVEASLEAPTKPGEATALQQIAYQMGINPSSKLADAMSGQGYRGPEGASAAAVGGDGSIVGRLVTQALLFKAIEDHMRDDLTGYGKMLGDNAALNRSIATTTWETPVLNFKRPANSRPQPIAQLSEPARMLTLTSSMKKNAILGEAIGIEYSDQVANDVTIDVVALSLKRQADESNAAQAMYQIMTLLNGDVDYGMLPLATALPGGAVTASDLDSAAGGGKLTQTAWVAWLWRNNLRRTITTVITDLAGAIAIENRIGRPNVQGDNAKSKRIDTLDNIVNPRWPDKVDVIITQDPSWPAGTIVGFDKRFAYNYIKSTAVDYKATEQDVIRRGTRMRFDSGSMVERFMIDAWDLLDIN